MPPSRSHLTRCGIVRWSPAVQSSLTILLTARATAWLAHAVTAMDAGASLLTGTELPMSVPVTELPELPPRWQIVHGSRSGSANERFIAYVTERGLIVTLQSLSGLPAAAPGRRIALITLGRHRVSVHGTGPSRFEARWDTDGGSHCLAVAGTTLGGFMPLVLNLGW
jgi:hypothetical protein